MDDDGIVMAGPVGVRGGVGGRTRLPPLRAGNAVRAGSSCVFVLALVSGLHLAASAEAGALASPAAEVDMPLGVDDAGSGQPIFDSPREQQVFDAIGFDFLSYHLGRAAASDDGAPRDPRHGRGFVSRRELERLDAWARQMGKGYLINNEGGLRERGDGNLYTKPGLFFQMPAEHVEFCRSSPHFMGIVYDEVGHAI